MHHVVSGVLVQAGRVLLCHRRADRAWYPDVWDFPGGHIEEGETAESALRRELREELGIEATGWGPTLGRWVEDSQEDITFVRVNDWTGDVANLAPDEHDEISWFTEVEALRLELPDPRYAALLEAVLRPTA
jgi:mutator protein MutT